MPAPLALFRICRPRPMPKGDDFSLRGTDKVSDYRLVVEFVTCYSGLGVRTISENPEIGIVRPLTVADIAERLQVSTRTVLQRIKESGVAFAPPGRSCRFSEDDYKLLFEATLRRSRSSSKPLAGFSSQGEITRAVEKQSRSRR